MKDRIPDNRFLFEENEDEEEKNDDLKLIKKLNDKLSFLLKFDSIDLPDEKKKRIGTIITTLIILVIIISTYYFLIYQPSQEALEIAKTDKLNELHSLYKGPLITSPDATNLENQIESANNEHEVKKINIVKPATKAWRNYLEKAVLSNCDSFNRTMQVLEDNNTSTIMSNENAFKIINSSDVYKLSKMDFKTPNTVTVPVLITRLQAGGGLLSVGSIVDIYTMNSQTTNSTSNSTQSNEMIKGCTVLAILRCEESGEVESEYSSTHNLVHGNLTNPNEDSQSFNTNVLELIKSSIAKGNDESSTIQLLKNYGVKLSNCEREINLGDLDAEYIILVEVPADKTNFLIENMDKIIMTIPTEYAPDWMINEISSTYM